VLSAAYQKQVLSAAYTEARLREREAQDRRTAAHWRRVALTVARMTGKRVSVDTATRTRQRGDE
jgi:hypothetical protein